MTLLSRSDLQPRSVRRADVRVSPPAREERPRSRRALAGFAEEIGILFRYAAGLDYYDRLIHLPKD